MGAQQHAAAVPCNTHRMLNAMSMMSPSSAILVAHPAAFTAAMAPSCTPIYAAACLPVTIAPRARDAPRQLNKLPQEGAPGRSCAL
jgi:hypothetical protein